MRELSIDIESYSEIDIKAGVYKYAERAEILLFAYSVDGGEVECVDMTEDNMCDAALPPKIFEALTDPNVIKKAFNANFERTVIGEYFNTYLDPEQWQCTMILAASAGLPLSLDEASKALGTAEKKDTIGKALIKYFCVPCKPTKANGGRTRNLPEHAPEKWAQFIEYCKQDVVTEQAICDSLSWLKIPAKEKELWDLDQKINERGVKVDMSLVHSAIRLDKTFRERLTNEAVNITGLDNANSVAQIKQWLEDEEMTDVKSLSKDSVQALIKTVDSEKAKRVLQIRAEMSKTSVKKYTTAIKAISSDGRVRGMFQFCGANRTWRWAGRILQLHNLPKITYEDPLVLDQLRNLVLEEDADTIDLCFGSIPNQLSELIRTMFVPEKGSRLLVGDYKAIEAVLLAWLAGEQWRLDIFKGEGKIYEASAAAMFNVPIETIKKGEGNYPLRAKGKVAELACIAEGQLVLTDKGLVPIEKVSIFDKVWDGSDWATHEGVIFKGYKEVIKYEGLSATKDHLVWVCGERGPVPFGQAATRGSHLVQSGNGGCPVRVGSNYQLGKKMEKRMEGTYGASYVYRMPQRELDKLPLIKSWKNKRLSRLLATQTSTSLVRAKIERGQTALRKPQHEKLQKLRRQRDTIQVHLNNGICKVGTGEFGNARKGLRLGSSGQQRSLRSWKSQIRIQKRQLRQPEEYGNSRLGTEIMAVCQNSSYQNEISRFNSRTDFRKSAFSSSGKAQELATNTRKVKVFDILNAGPNNRFTVSNVLVHNCGYQGGVGALEKMGALNMGLTAEELPAIIKAWRAASPNIVKLWYGLQRAAIDAIETGELVKYGDKGLAFKMKRGNLLFRLPSGRCLVYPQAAILNYIRKVPIYEERFKPDGSPYQKLVRYEHKPSKKITFYGVNPDTKQWGLLDTYGGKLTENCLASDTKVLTLRGKINIFEVTNEDWLWDGVEWVKSDWVVCNGKRKTIDVNGVRMTGDHRILTENGWKKASSCAGLNRSKVQQSYCIRILPLGRKKINLVGSVHLWSKKTNTSQRIIKVKDKILRVHEKGAYRSEAENSWNGYSPGLQSVAVNERSVRFTNPSSMGKLRGQRNPGLRKVDGFQKFLERCGCDLPTRFIAGQDKGQRELYERKLPLGYSKRASQEYAIKHSDRNSLGQNYSSRSFGEIRGKRNYFTLSPIGKVPPKPFILSAGFQEQVYDIVNCGPRNRFTVIDNDGNPFIVHNCIQAIARDCLAEGMLAVEKAGYPIIIHVHDEIVAEMPIGKGSVKEMLKIMAKPPLWGQDIPLIAEGAECSYYSK